MSRIIQVGDPEAGTTSSERIRVMTATGLVVGLVLRRSAGAALSLFQPLHYVCATPRDPRPLWACDLVIW